MDTVCKTSTVDTDCEMNTLDTACEMNTLDTACEMNTLDTACEMNTLDTACEMNALDAPCEMNIVGELNTLDVTCEMSSLNTTYQMNTLQCNNTIVMNTLDHNNTVVMNTLDRNNTIVMGTLESNNTVKMNTLESDKSVVKNPLKIVASERSRKDALNNSETTYKLKPACEVNFFETVWKMNSLETVCQKQPEKVFDQRECAGKSKPFETMCEIISVQTKNKCTVNKESDIKYNSCEELNVAAMNKSNPASVIDDEQALSSRNDTIKNILNVVSSDSASDEPVCKKPKLEIEESVEDSSPLLRQSSDFLENEHTNSSKKGTSSTSEISLDSPSCTASTSLADVISTHSIENVVCSKDKTHTTEKQLPLTEIQAGITEYLGSHKGFSAIIKQRYSDFIVNEIDIQGNVVHLTQMEPPESLDEGPSNEECTQQDNNITSGIISDEDIAKLESLVQSEDKKGLINIIAPADKDSRTKIHIAVKKRYSQLETKTAEVNKEKVIQVLWKSGNSRDRRQKDDWPESKKDCKYVKFVLYKENKDTMDAIGLIAKNLKVREGLFQYAGTKDKRAKTTQEITAQRIHPKKLAFMNKVLWNMSLGNFQFVKEPLKLGQLSGNQFVIVLRNVQASNETVDTAMLSLKTLGFVNYFGMQRFGTTSVPTHKVGCALLLGDWEKAVELILMPREDNPSKAAFQKVWQETRDPVATLKVIPSYFGLERNLLEALKKKMKPFNALEKISRNTRLLYVHSYQALVWNKMVSKRLQVMGPKPVVGDLAMVDNTDSSERSCPILITEDTVDKYSLQHLVLPLPGHDVIYPSNEVHSWYRDTMAADGLDMDKMKRPQKDYSLPGAYRYITTCPTDVTWSHHHYDDYSLPLTLSDMDVIKGENVPDTCNKGKFKAVVLKMNLPTSCYATMALREVLHVDTSSAHQTSLNVS